MTGLSILALGFALGMRHATDADHLAAIATLATRASSRDQALRHGLAWGIGHTLTLLLLGGTALALDESLPPRFAMALELGVGAMLLVLGVDVLRRRGDRARPGLMHRHGSGWTAALHVHHPASAAGTLEGVPKLSSFRYTPMPQQQTLPVPLPATRATAAPLPLRAVMIGVMHGMAGSAALILLTLERAPSFAAGFGYLLLFGMGSIIGMALLSMLIATPLRMSAGAMMGALHRLLTLAIGLVSVAIGGWTIFRITAIW